MEPIQIENVEALKKRVFNAGFGAAVAGAIDEGLAAGQTEIRPFVSEVIENRRIDFEPEIKVKDGKGYYNGFKATFYNEDGTTINQWFKSADRVTINEAYILLMDQQQPRAVHKTYYNEEKERYGQWIQLDFSQKTESGNFLTKRHNDYDIVAKLNDYDFVELNTERQKVTAAVYMAEGREIAVTPVNQEKYSKVYMRANPERGTLTFMDDNGTPLYHDQFRTQAARERIQQEKNTKQAGVSFIRNKGNEQPSADQSSVQNNPDDQKKNSSLNPESLKPSKRPRIVQETGKQKSKSI